MVSTDLSPKARNMDRIPKPLILYPSRTKWILPFAGSAIFMVVGVWVLVTQDHSAAIWFSVLGSVGCSIVFATILLPGSSSLTLDADGFQMKQFYRVRKIRWQNVTNIHSGNIRPSRIKTVRYNDSQLSGGKLAKLETTTLGYNAMLPDTYGMTADDLAALMTQWRDRGLASN
jgi:hypothetical protein